MENYNGIWISYPDADFNTFTSYSLIILIDFSANLEKLSEYLEAWEMVLVPVAFSSLSEDFDDEGREPVFDKAVDLADLADSCLDSDLESISGAVWDLAELDLVLGFDVAETGLEPLLD